MPADRRVRASSSGIERAPPASITDSTSDAGASVYMGFFAITKAGVLPTSDENVLERVNNGEILLYRHGMQEIGFFDLVYDALLECVARQIGAARTAQLKQRGIEHIHEFIDGKQVLEVYLDMRKILAASMPFHVKKLCREMLGVDQCYIHAHALIRMFVPHRLLQENLGSFKKHLGKLDLHGPHHDHYQKVALNAINLWMALGPVRKDNSMSFYTDTWGKNLPRGKDHVASDQYLGEPVNFACEAGDIVLFHSHMMHSSVLNSSQETRIALTNRFTVEPPLHPDGDDMSKYFRSELVGEGEPPASAILVQDKRTASRKPSDFTPRTKDMVTGWKAKAPSELKENEITAIDGKTCAANIGGKLQYFARKCPHIGADLSLGYVRDGRLHCPWHNLSFDPATGVSACAAVKPLKLFKESGSKLVEA
jgi:nitrite reductase/ring-hydroxylating ferredoxin subunit